MFLISTYLLVYGYNSETILLYFFYTTFIDLILFCAY